MAAAAILSLACGEGGAAASCSLEPRTTKEGLVVEDLRCGRGELAEPGDVVEVRYSAEIVGGRSLRSGVLRFALGAGQVIAGWDEGVRGMRVGGTRRLRVPPELGFGREGALGLVPGDATLVFRIELLEAVDR